MENRKNLWGKKKVFLKPELAWSFFFPMVDPRWFHLIFQNSRSTTMYNSQQADMHLTVYFVYKSQKYKVLLFLHERLTLQYLSSEMKWPRPTRTQLVFFVDSSYWSCSSVQRGKIILQSHNFCSHCAINIIQKKSLCMLQQKNTV